MKLTIQMEVSETYSNIGLAKAITESALTADDIREIAQYLWIFAETRKKSEDTQC